MPGQRQDRFSVFGQRLARFLAVLFVCQVLVSCGLKGPLYMPGDEENEHETRKEAEAIPDHRQESAY
jgi:predicted small lipoprotein YifL